MSTSIAQAGARKAKPNFFTTSGAADALGDLRGHRRFLAVEPDARVRAATPGLLVLAQRVARLNPDAGEIGAGMLKSLVTDARAVVQQAGGSKEW